MEVLVTARQEYQKQLCNVMTPHMIVAFQEMYEEAEKISKNKNVLKHYQSLLKDVKAWNSNIVKQHVDSINNSCSWYNDLLAAVFVSAVKILSSVKLSNERKKLNIKIPSNETFIQGCYENVARDLYKNPYIFADSLNEYERDDALMKRFNESIHLTIDNMIPVQEILKTNIGDRTPGEVDINTGLSESDDEDPEVDEDEDDAGEPVPEGVDTDEVVGTIPAPVTEHEQPMPRPIEDHAEVKEISMDKSVEDDEDVLFPGAPER
jgi:hypothetical protein